MTTFAQMLASHLVIATALAVVVFAFTRVWRNPQLAHALWILVLLKLVTPPIVTIVLPAWLGQADTPPSVAGRSDPATSSASLAASSARIDPSADAVVREKPGVGAAPFAPAATLPVESASRMPHFDWRQALLWAWSAGSLVVALVGLSRIGRFSRLVAETDVADAEIQSDAVDLARRLGMSKAPDVRVVCAAIPPVVWSLGRGPVILLPTPLLAELSRAERRTILAHELAHVRRHDHWVRWLEALIFVVYWWNPIVWLARRELNRAEEECCDAWVVWLAPDCRRAYAEAIVQTVEYLAAARTLLPVVASGVGRNWPLKDRVVAILADPRAHRLSFLARAAVVVAALVGLPLAAVPGSAAKSPKPAGQDAAAASASAEPGAAPDRRANEAALAAPKSGEASPSESAAGTSEEKTAESKPALRGRLFARGYVYENDQLQGMAIVAVDPENGAWKRLAENSDSFAVSPDGQTIFYSSESALWSGDARSNANPGKVFHESGHVVVSPDSKSLLVTTWTSKANKPDEKEATVWKMGIDGTSSVPIAGLTPWTLICDWSSDGRWLLVERDQAIHLVQPEGKESRQIAKGGYHPQFSPDARQVVYTDSWKGMIRVVGIDGTGDKIVYQAPHLVFANRGRWSTEGKHLASVLMDLSPDKGLFADPKITHPRLVIIDVANGAQRVLPLPQQDGWDFYPTGEIDWR